MGRTLQIPVAEAYLPLLQPARYKGAYGGRGSAKSHFFGGLLIDDHLAEPGLRSVCLREVQKSLDQSVKRLLEDKIEEFYLTNEFRITKNHIEAPGGGLIMFQGMQDHTAESIKSLEGFRRAWVEEAQSLSDRSLTLLRPTIRTERCSLCLKKGDLRLNPVCEKSPTGFHDIQDPEIWFSWNPDSEKDPVDKFMRKDKPDDAIVVNTSFADNPWFPAVLEKEMAWDLRIDPEKHAYVWRGGYQKRSNSRVFKNWRVEEFVAPERTRHYLGADWGFSVDPSTLVRSHESRTDPETGKEWPRKRLYIDYDLFQIGVEIEFMPRFFDGLICGCRINLDGTPIGTCRDTQMHGWARPWPIIADSARPETISHLRRHGYGGMESAKKGAGSVKEGVIFLQSWDIIIHPRCVHTIDEFTNYSYEVDPKDPNIVLPILADKKNHIIDPVRYSLEQLRGQLRIREAVWG